MPFGRFCRNLFQKAAVDIKWPSGRIFVCFNPDNIVRDLLETSELSPRKSNCFYFDKTPLIVFFQRKIIKRNIRRVVNRGRDLRDRVAGRVELT